ncbi:hypothetical protein M1N87_01570 [Dehalococcoidia bacterium]|nr:hypothetical protein [Dehalococcoidia bacterium]
MFKKIINRLHRNERGITGLETAIILIAFVVVASVFAYTVLSAGLFSAQQADETVRSGIRTTQTTMKLRGAVHAFADNATTTFVERISFTVSNVLGEGQAIDLTPSHYLGSDGKLMWPLMTPSVISDCDTVWTTAPDVTVSLDAEDYKESPRSVKLDVGDAFTTGLLAYYDTSILNLTAATQVSLWIQSSVDLAPNDLQLLLSTDDQGNTPAGGDGAAGTLNIPVDLAANRWRWVVIDLPNPNALEAIESVALSARLDPGAVTIHLDEVRALVMGGRSVTIISFDDANKVIPEVAWTVEFGGGYEDDGDFLLEDVERATITVWLAGTHTGNYTGLTTNAIFNIQVMPPQGATLLIQKRTPPHLGDIMRLQ